MKKHKLYGHSIKNPYIIHLLFDRDHYICNRACNITDSKSTRDIKKVTCKNCKKYIRKKEVKRLLKKYDDENIAERLTRIDEQIDRSLKVSQKTLDTMIDI